jgi:hypothetical protein
VKRTVLIAVAFYVLTAFIPASTAHDMPSISLPPAFERLTSLVGEWQGVGEGMEQTVTSFRVVANGSVLVEDLRPSAAEEMVNVYHPDGSDVVMTHYCAAGNQPRMRCTQDGGRLAFTMSDITNWKKGDVRMNAVTLVFVDGDHMDEEWTSDTDGKPESFTMHFARKK